MGTLTPSAADALRRIATAATGLRLLMLFGSRARGDAHLRSDWDFAYIADAAFDSTALLTSLVEALDSEAVDLADLERASGLLRFRVARDGIVLFESTPRLAEHFRLQAADFWCDVGPVLARGYEDVLASLDR